MRVLVVEDDVLIRDLVVELLQDEGYQVIQAASSEEALSHCRRGAADVLVTDIRLPGNIDGWDIADRCRAAHPGLLVIYTTGFSPVAQRPVPGSMTLHKPFHLREIVRAIRQLDDARRGR